MAACENNIFQNIYATCENKIVSGIEQKIYLFNRKDVSYELGDGTNFAKNEIVSFSVKSGKTGYVAMGLKKNLTSGFERIISETAPDQWRNTLSLISYEFDKNAMRNIDEMGDIVAIIERKGVKSEDGSFLALGLENGLYIDTDSWSANDNGGARSISLSSLDEAGESFSSYVVTLANTDVPESDPSRKISTYEEIKNYLDGLIDED